MTPTNEMAALAITVEVAIEPVDGKAMPYWPRTQLVDGGYIENSGLATITDMSDDWLSLVRDHNEEALATEGSTEPLVVPIVVFLTNGDRRVVQPAINSSTVSELAVPLLTYLRGGSSPDLQGLVDRNVLLRVGVVPDGHEMPAFLGMSLHLTPSRLRPFDPFSVWPLWGPNYES